jgi:hypothetical protein
LNVPLLAGVFFVIFMALYQNYKISGCHFLQASHLRAHHNSGQYTLWLWFHNFSPLAFPADVEPMLERCCQDLSNFIKHVQSICDLSLQIGVSINLTIEMNLVQVCFSLGNEMQ